MTAPLIDAMNERCVKDIFTMLKSKEEQFKKEIANLNKKEANLQKKLEKLEPEEPKDVIIYLPICFIYPSYL